MATDGNALPAWVLYTTPTFDQLRDASRVALTKPRYSTQDWRGRRMLFLAMAGRRCADCGGAATEVHHLHYRTVGRETPHDVLPLCEACHAGRHGHGPGRVDFHAVLRGMIGGHRGR